MVSFNNLAMLYHKVEVHNGKNTSFWYDNWSRLGCLKNFLNGRGSLDLGIMNDETVADALRFHRRRRHRIQIFNEVEDVIDEVRSQINGEEDESLWKQNENKYTKKFSTKYTWLLMRHSQPNCLWSKGIWFPYSTPKYSFMTWIAMKNRLQTGDRIQQWNSMADGVCILCRDELETCQHLFFRCSYSEEIWRTLVGGIMREEYTMHWNEIVDAISNSRRSATEMFLLRYAFQSLVHSIWKERNDRRHGEQPKDERTIAKLVDKQIRLKLLLVKGKGKKHLEEGLCKWFETRV